ncbi:unnamed protein product [Rhizopus microsporus]
MEHEHHIKITVPESAQDLRVRKKEISINGCPTEETRRLNAGDIIEINYNKSIEEAERLETIPIDILYQDEHLAVVWKPPGQNSAVFEKAIHHNTAEIDSKGNKQKIWCINDIQKAASGLILVAKSERVKELLMESYMNDKINFTMRVICHGRIDTTVISDLFCLDQSDKAQESKVNPKDVLKSIDIISATRSNHAQYITTLDLHLRSPLSSLQLRKLFFFQSKHPIIGESAYTKLLHVNKDKGLYASIIHVSFLHPIKGTQVQVTGNEPQKFAMMREREFKFYQKKIERENEAMKKAGIDVSEQMDRENGQLLAYVLGQKDFFNLTFKVTKDCLIPRPASETLVKAAIDFIKDRNGIRLIDIGTGCGNLVISIMANLPSSAITSAVAIDISDAALAVAKENGEAILGKDRSKRIEWRNQSMSDVADGKVYDILVCNPPYLDYNQISKRKVQMADLGQEPHTALFAEDGGFKWYNVLSEIAPNIVKDEGRVILECGKGILQQVLDIWAGWEQEAIYKDVQGWDRCIVLKRTT